METFFCNNCKLIKSIGDFYIRPNGKPNTPCKECQRKQKEEWRKNNPNYNKIYRQENKEELSEKKKIYAKNNKEKLSKKQKEWWEENKEEINQKRREKYEKDPTIKKQRAIEWRKNNLEQAKAYERSEKRRESRRKRNRAWAKKILVR